MTNKVYDVLKLLGLIVLPIVEFITTILKIWNVPYTEQITATLIAFNVLIGALVVIANKIYNSKLESDGDDDGI